MLAEPILFSNQGDLMKYAAPLFFSTALLILSGCSSLKVSSEKITPYDYKSVNSYEWVSAPKKILAEDDTFFNENVHTALNNELAGRGWKQVMESDKADLQIVYYIKLAEHEEYTAPVNQDETRVTGGFTFDKDKGKWGYNDQDPDLNVYTIEVGTLSLLIYDADTGEKVWTGTLQTRLDRTTPLDKQPELLARIARKIVGKIPSK
jgi:hypothetical protein